MARFATELSMLILSRIELKYAVPASCFFNCVLLVQQPFGMLGREVVVRISEKRLGGSGQFGIIVARAQCLAGVWRRGHGVDVGIIRISGVSVVIERRNLFDLRQQTLINLLHVGTGKRARLGRSTKACRQQRRT